MSYPRRSVPHAELDAWYEASWAYVMPDFDKPGNYIVEWRSTSAPVEPNRVPDNSTHEIADGSAGR